MALRRIWHGWTTPENADAYQSLLLEEIIPGIRDKNIPGYRGMEVLRRRTSRTGEVEFITIMAFDSLENVIAFQGEDYRRAYVPEKARKVLKRWDSHASHYEVMADISY
ncbi:MAG: hypothetical protein U5K31_10770 [Balneolaceae bacterium]|nr:hypothetical protein [Balneolaceae bacterium]